MPSPEIEEFAKLVVQHVRDAAIRNGDQQLRPDIENVVVRRWREAARDGNLESIAKTIIPDVVDDAMFYLLQSIDQGALRLSFTSSNGTEVNLTTDGLSELAGWYMASGGWRASYARERFVDDFSDLQ